MNDARKTRFAEVASELADLIQLRLQGKSAGLVLLLKALMKLEDLIIDLVVFAVKLT